MDEKVSCYDMLCVPEREKIQNPAPLPTYGEAKKNQKIWKIQKPQTGQNLLSDFHIAQNVPIDPRAFKALADWGEPDGEDGAKQADEDNGHVVGAAARDGELRRQAVEDAHNKDEERGEDVAHVAETAKVKRTIFWENMGATAEEDEHLWDGVGDVLN